jgi:XRE family transcriptional regulator, fatty acid utilization regulator
MDVTSIPFRIRSLRERHHLSQEEFAEKLGFKDRQTLSDIELGNRKISPEELLTAADILGVELKFFTDPFELAGEGQFSWRQKNVAPADLDAYEAKAGCWLAAYRYLSKLKGLTVNSQILRVALDRKSTFEEAALEGEVVGEALGLGETPAEGLASVFEDKLGTLVLYVDAVPGVSGAACQLKQLNTVLINRNEPLTRQAYDLAHEFFHLLTWEKMPPKRVECEKPQDNSEKRVEQLAENFAAGLLIPRKTISKIVANNPIPQEDGLGEWIITVADAMKVSPTAMMWRLVNLNYITKAAADRLTERHAFANGIRAKANLKARFSKHFVDVLGWGIEAGHISARRAASLLDTTVDDVAALFSEYQLNAPFDL